MQAQIAERWETQNEAGRRFYGRGDFARAEQAFAAAIREAEQLGPGDLRLATSLANLAQLKLRQRNYDEADRLFSRSLQIREAALGTDHASLVQTVNGLAAVSYARGDLDAAEPLFRRALSITERRLGAQHPDIVTSLNSLARIAFKRNDEQSTRQRAAALRGHQAASAGLMPLSPPAPNATQDVFDPHPTPAGLRPAVPSPATPRPAVPSPAAPRAAVPPSAPPTAALGDLLIYLPESAGATPVGSSPPHAPRRDTPSPIPDLLLGPTSMPDPDMARNPVSTPLPEMPRISMDDSRDQVLPRRKTPPAAPPPLPEAPRPAAEPNAVEGAGAEIAPVPVAPPPPPPRPAPPPVRHHDPPPRRP